jgi:Phospholipase_D-nuclease N-terminal
VFPVLAALNDSFRWLLLGIWVAVLSAIIIDILTSRDLKGWMKAIWVVLVVGLPLVGPLVYLVIRGSRMYRRIRSALWRPPQPLGDDSRKA